MPHCLHGVTGILTQKALLAKKNKQWSNKELKTTEKTFIQVAAAMQISSSRKPITRIPGSDGSLQICNAASVSSFRRERCQSPLRLLGGSLHPKSILSQHLQKGLDRKSHSVHMPCQCTWWSLIRLASRYWPTAPRRQRRMPPTQPSQLRPGRNKLGLES